MHLSMRQGIFRQSNIRFSMLMFVVVCLGIFSAFMTNTQVAAQLTQSEQGLLDQSQTIVNETNEIFKEFTGNVTEFSEVRIALASLQTSTDPLIKQQRLDKAQTLFNQITELRLELGEHLANLKNISDSFNALLTASTTTAKPTSTVEVTQQPIDLCQPPAGYTGYFAEFSSSQDYFYYTNIGNGVGVCGCNPVTAGTARNKNFFTPQSKSNLLSQAVVIYQFDEYF